jgi:GH15 family glucan-1,4-alpha-glucosidase
MIAIVSKRRLRGKEPALSMPKGVGRAARSVTSFALHTSRVQLASVTACPTAEKKADRVARLRRSVRPSRFLRGTLPYLVALTLSIPSSAQKVTPPLELTRTVRTWEFLPVVGTRAGLFGNETGRFEAWVYPLKILRGFHLTFHVGGRALPAESLTRTLTVRPESATLVYVGDSFRVTETMFVPVREPGAVILLDIKTKQPLEIEAAFTPDFALEWPAGLGATFSDWDAVHHTVVLGEETKKFAALVGSPTAQDPHLAYETNYSSSDETSFRLGATQAGRDTKLVVIAASVSGRDDAQKTYDRLTATYVELLLDSANYYRTYLAQTVNLELPDGALQQGYDWARISELQGLVTNPVLGTGLVAGYRTSGVTQRPGFAWFFGRDSLWTSFALNAVGDYSTTRTALEFIGKYQREDGKIPHEIAQGGNFVPWFRDYPYPYASADATPLYIIAMDDYATQSGDLAFVQDNWDGVWRAYQFLRSTYDEQGFPKNLGVGHGWVEGGPLLPVKTEYYQSGLGTEALRALSHLAGLVGKRDIEKDLAGEFERRQTVLDNAFWSPDKGIYAFALNQSNQRVEEPSVLSTVPMWFGLPDVAHAGEMITQLAGAEHQTDWGMRIISSRSQRYDGSGYHFGAVWPLFTGWASVGEYRYHRALPAYFNLRANALLARDGSLGHVTEVLSGDYYQSFSTSSPHQIWSAAMVVSPILRGMFGLRSDAPNRLITLTPHIPADWTTFALRNIHLGAAAVDFQYRKTTDSIVLETRRRGSGDCWVEFSPALSLRTEVVSVEMNGRPLPHKLLPNDEDQHLWLRFPVYGGPNIVVVKLKNDFGLSLDNNLPALGGTSRGPRVLAESWNASRTQLTLQLSAAPGEKYEFEVWNPAQVTSVDGATLDKLGRLRFDTPEGPDQEYLRRTVILHFAKP